MIREAVSRWALCFAALISAAMTTTRVEAQPHQINGRGSLGFATGLVFGRTDLSSGSGEQARLFLRRALSPRWTVEAGAGLGRLNGDEFATDLGLVDVRFLYVPVQFAAWQGYLSTGFGVLGHSIEDLPVDLLSPDFEREGWSAMAPAGIGILWHVGDRVGLDFSGSYTFGSRDDLDAVTTGKGEDGFWSGSLGLVVRGASVPRFPLP